MNIKQLQKATSELCWDLDFYDFCRYILRQKNSEEELMKDAYCRKKWQEWQQFSHALHFFDDDFLNRVITVHKKSHQAKTKK